MEALQSICIEIELRTSAETTNIRGNFTNSKEAADYLRKLADEIDKLHTSISTRDAAQNR
jgi:hypothetical protein